MLLEQVDSRMVIARRPGVITHGKKCITKAFVVKDRHDS